MKILAFDQSTRVSGWAVIQDGNLVDSGVIDLHKIDDTNVRSKQMGISICEIISCKQPDLIVIEEVQQQTNTSTVIKLARIQGIIIGFAAAHNIKLEILTPTQWRSQLEYKQGPKIKRAELKKQSLDYVKNHFGENDYSEDRCEAICIGLASYEIFDLWNY